MNRMMSRKSLGVGVLLGLAGAGLAACDDAGDEQEIRYQCAIERNGVAEAVDCDEVNDNDGNVNHGGVIYPVFIHSYSHAGAGAAYSPGSRLPAGGYRIGYKDSAGRTRAGLPSTGRIANGTVKTGVIGKGGAPAAGKAGG